MDAGNNNVLKPSIRLGLLSNASGSVQYGLCGSKALVAVHGPKQIEKRMAGQSDSWVAECALVCSVEVPDWEGQGAAKTQDERRLERQLAAALQPVVLWTRLPLAVIHVAVMVLQVGGALLPTLLHAACLALVDAGIPMGDLLAACTLSYAGGQVRLMGSAADEATQDGGMCVVCTGAKNEVVLLLQEGCMPPATCVQGVQQCMDMCAQVDKQHREQARALLASMQPT